MNTPVLFLIFNRPKLTQQVFNAIRQAKPKYLYIAADGPRNENTSDISLCEQTRDIALKVDWDCDVNTLFRAENLGCKAAVSRAISWFFENVEEGIILEDDCLPDASFFSFCEQLLEKYRTDNSVMSISGSNLLGEPWKYDTQSYFFAHGGIWGWATWKRAWALYDAKMSGWQHPETRQIIRQNIRTEEWYQFYYQMLDASFNGTLDTWDIQWFYTILLNNGLAINPAVNLVRNIGFANGTHLNSDDNSVAKLTNNKIDFPLVPPLNKEVDVEYLHLMYRAINENTSAQKSIFARAFNYIIRSVNKKILTPARK